MTRMKDKPWPFRDVVASRCGGGPDLPAGVRPAGQTSSARPSRRRRSFFAGGPFPPLGRPPLAFVRATDKKYFALL